MRITHIEFYVDFKWQNYRAVGSEANPKWKPESKMTDKDWENNPCNIRTANEIINDMTWKHVKWEESCPKMDGHSFTVDPEEIPYTLDSVEAFFEACAKLIRDQVLIKSSCAPYIHNRGNENYYDPVWRVGEAICPAKIVTLLKKKS